MIIHCLPECTKHIHFAEEKTTVDIKNTYLEKYCQTGNGTGT